MTSYNFSQMLRSFLQHDGLPFSQALPEEEIEQAFAGEGVTFGQAEGSVYTPAITLGAFLSQVLFKDEQRSCLAAVSRVIVMLVALGREPCSDNTGAYCRARAKLPTPLIRRLATQVADGCERRVPRHWLWKGRCVKLVDGSTASMPDTPENQAAWPQPSSQKPGLGFPIIRMVVLLSLATAMVTDMAMGPYAGKETGETALLRELFGSLQRGDVLLADRYYCSYFMIALLVERGIDIVVRLHQARAEDFRRGRRLGKNDRLDTWLKPAKPAWMDQATYDRLPDVLHVRKVRVQINQPGFRVESLVVVTTLTDSDAYTSADIAELYHKRWLAELDIRSIKCSLGMDVLRCQTPDMVRKEIWTHLLAYNLIRQAMLEAALAAGKSPRQLSFTAALQKVAASWQTIATCADGIVVNVIAIHLQHIAGHQVGHRPGRVEPRAKKRRPKPHKLLNKPRDQARKQLLDGATE